MKRTQWQARMAMGLSAVVSLLALVVVAHYPLTSRADDASGDTVFAAGAVRFPTGEFPLTDQSRTSVDFSEITSGGPPRDGIPSIDAPVFIAASDADAWLQDREPVIAVRLAGEARAYPLQILIYHEIVNDVLGDVLIAVTFCPLCNASIVFNRKLGDTTLDFGTTGRLRNSDLLMYDRQTESWWQQFTGRGIIGRYDGQVLEQLPSQIVSYAAFKQAMPKGRVLSRETGARRPYGNNPYRGYDDIESSPFLFSGEIDERLPPMQRVLRIPGKGVSRLVPLTEPVEHPVLNLEIDGAPTVVLAFSSAASALDQSDISQSRDVPAAAAFRASVDGKPLTFVWQDAVLRDEQTGSEWNAFGQAISGELAGTELEQIDRGVHFAFALLAFEPDAVIETVKR